MSSRRMQILLPVLLLTGVVPTLAAQAPALKVQTPTTAAGPRVNSDWRSYEPQLPRDRTDASALPKPRTVTVETWVIIVAAVVLILILV